MSKTKFFLRLSTVCIILCMAIFALTACFIPSSGTCGAEGDGSNLAWEFDSGSGLLTISGSGAMEDFDYATDNPPSWKSIKNLITSIVISDGVTSIGSSAFQGYDDLTSVTIPDSVTSIGDDAFASCESLTSITIPNGVTSIGDNAFSNCESLTDITLPNSVTSIGNSAFSWCESLTGITIPDGVTNIGESTFSHCLSLASVTMPDSVTSIGEYAFYECSSLNNITIPDSVTSIGNNAFSHCLSLASVTIPDGVTNIGDYTFSHCLSLASVTMPDSVTSIGERAFQNCSSLTDITIPNGVTNIQYETFYSCSNLRTVNIGSGVRIISAYAFYSCENLESVKFSKTYGWSSERGYMLTSSELSDPASAADALKFHESYTITLESSTSGKFGKNSSNLTWSIDDAGVLTIAGTGEMENFDQSNVPWHDHKESITAVVIGDRVTSIGENAFYGCNGISSVTFNSPAEWIVNGSTISYDELSKPDVAAQYITQTYVNTNWIVIGILGSGACGDNLYWTLSEHGKLTISGSGDMTNYSTSNDVPWHGESWNTLSEIKAENITEIIFQGEITSIGSCAFIGCKNVTSITIPDSVTSIGKSAFMSCEGLTSIEIPSGTTYIGETAFLGSGITTITIPDGVTMIENGTFRECLSLESVILGAGVQSIGQYAFQDCKKLSNVAFPNELTSIGIYAFEHCESFTDITLPDSLTFIGGSAFSGCPFETVTIPKGITKIDASAFASCGLKQIILHDNITSIEQSAFYYCYNLTSIEIPDSVTIIGEDAFYKCDNLHDITIGTGVRSIYQDAFYSYESKNIYISDLTKWCNIYIENGLFYYSVGNNLYLNNELVTDLVIPDGVEILRSYIFDFDCIESITIPSSVTTIKPWAICNIDRFIFEEYSDWEIWSQDLKCPEANYTELIDPEAAADRYYKSLSCEWRSISSGSCENNISWKYNKSGVLTISGYDAILDYSQASVPWAAKTSYITSIVISYGVTSIGDSAFKDLINLTSVSIGNSVTKISDNAFSGCINLETVTISSLVTEIGKNAFSGCSSLTSIKIPSGVTEIGENAFGGCTNLTSATFENPFDWGINDTKILDTTLSQPASAAQLLTETYVLNGWICTPAVLLGKGNCGAEGDGSNLTWRLTEKGVLTISGTGSMTDFNSYASPWYNYYNQIKSIIISDGVTSIGNYAFYNCAYVSEMDLPDSINRIGKYAFYYCSNITEVDLPSATFIGEEAFASCAGLTKIKTGNNVTSIGRYAFRNCTALATIEIGDFTECTPITEIASNAFDGCSAIVTLRYGNAVKGEVDGSTFMMLTTLKTVELGDGITAIGANTFFMCSSLTTLKLGDNITNIGGAAFAMCSALQSFDIPANIEIIGEAAFSGCTALNTVVIPATMTEFNASAFLGCPITQINVDAGNKVYSSIGGVLFTADGKTLVLYPAARTDTSYTVPNGTETIGPEAFATATNLTSVVMSSSVKKIGLMAFSGCAFLANVDFSNVTEIDMSAFMLCVSLTEINLPDSLTIIRTSAFASSGVSKVTIGKNLEIIEDYVFSACPITSFEISALNENFSAIDGSLYSKNGYTLIQYAIGKTATSFTVPSDVKEIYDGAFAFAPYLKEVTLPEGLMIIGEEAFGYCHALTEITIPKSVIEIELGAFRECLSLKSIEVAKENTVYASINGSLYSHNVETLIQYAIGKTDTSFTVPSHVKTIAPLAFEASPNLITVVISEGVEAIGSAAFSRCSALKNVTLPASLIFIGQNAFAECESLENATFKIKRGWRLSMFEDPNETPISDILAESNFTDPANAAQLLANDGRGRYWHRIENY